MIRRLTLGLLTASVLGTVGCVPNETSRKYEALQNVNRSLVQMFGAKSPDDLIGMPFSDGWLDSDALQAAEKIMKGDGDLVDF